MNKSKFWWLSLIIMIITIGTSSSVCAQSSSLPAKIRFSGSVGYDFGMDKVRNVNCYLDLKFNRGQVSGTTNYMTDYEGNPSQVEGTVKTQKNGTYHIDVYVLDNSGCNFDGYYNPKTGAFTGKFIGRGMSRSYNFQFKKL